MSRINNENNTKNYKNNTKNYPLSDTNIVIIDRESDYLDSFTLSDDTTGGRIDVSENAGASTSYMHKLATRVSNTINSVQFKEAMGEDTYVKFHRAGDEPTNLVMPSLSSRSVTVTKKDPYTNNEMPVKMTAYVGTAITSKPSSVALAISMAHERFDFECDGVVTELTLQQEMQQILLQLDREITSKLVKALEDEDKKGLKYFTNLKVSPIGIGSVVNQYDQIEEGIYSAVRSMAQFGGQLEDFIIGVTPAVYAVMERIARRTGHDTVESFVGTNVYQYQPQTQSANLYEVFVMPRALVAVSFREEADGVIIEPIVTRNAYKQSTTIEFVGVLDLICDGFTTVKGTGSEGEPTQMDIKLPIITKVSFDKKVQPEV